MSNHPRLPGHSVFQCILQCSWQKIWSNYTSGFGCLDDDSVPFHVLLVTSSAKYICSLLCSLGSFKMGSPRLPWILVFGCSNRRHFSIWFMSFIWLDHLIRSLPHQTTFSLEVIQDWNPVWNLCSHDHDLHRFSDLGSTSLAWRRRLVLQRLFEQIEWMGNKSLPVVLLRCSSKGPLYFIDLGSLFDKEVFD